MVKIGEGRAIPRYDMTPQSPEEAKRETEAKPKEPKPDSATTDYLQFSEQKAMEIGLKDNSLKKEIAKVFETNLDDAAYILPFAKKFMSEKKLAAAGPAEFGKVKTEGIKNFKNMVDSLHVEMRKVLNPPQEKMADLTAQILEQMQGGDISEMGPSDIQAFVEKNVKQFESTTIGALRRRAEGLPEQVNVTEDTGDTWTSSRQQREAAQAQKVSRQAAQGRQEAQPSDEDLVVDTGRPEI